MGLGLLFLTRVQIPDSCRPEFVSVGEIATCLMFQIVRSPFPKVGEASCSARLEIRLGPLRCRRVGLGNLTPSPSQNSGLEPLDSSGSCHPVRAAALRQNRRAPPVSSWPIMVPTWIACLLRSTDITPLQRYYQAVRPSASHPYSRPRGSVHLWLLRLYRCQGSHVPYARLF